ncbi:MAG: T9SS type A sorting domain-containing protein [Polaribacter sp.]|nr:T9SS type A sorting domain-containing protein [Polaribacter sp.]
MKQKNFLKLITLTFLFLTSVSSLGQLASYPLTADGVATGVNANITATDFSSTGVSSLSFGSSGAFSNIWSTAAIETGKYFEITLVPNAGYITNVSEINFSERRSGTGPRDYQVRWSVDDFSNSTTIATVNVPDNKSERDGSITGLDIDVAVGETLKIRWYGYNAESTGGTWRINDGTLNIVGTATLSSTPTVSFDEATSGVTETNVDIVTAGIPISFINYTSSVTITPTVNGASTAEPGDYIVDLTPIVFSANETINIPLTIKPDADTDHETIIIDFTVTSGTATLGISQHTFTITDDEAPSVETFDNSNATSSYADNNFVGNNGITWTYIASRDENGDSNGAGISGKALMLRRVSDGSKVTSSSISGGIKDFSVKLYKGFTGGGDRQVEVFINSVSYGTSAAFDDNSEHIFTINNINVTGNFVIEIINTQSGQIIVDDISWSSFSPATVTWDGSDGTNWATAANWDTDEVPTAGDNVIIANVANQPIIGSSTNAVANDLTINTGATLSISNNGTLIVYGTSSGDVTYNRTLDTENWYLVSSPVAGETYDNDYVAANSLAVNGTNNAIATYTTSAESWSYMQTGGGGGTFTTGNGYSVRRETGAGSGTISFTGTINTTDVTPAVVIGGNGFNLLGNPYTSYLNSASFLTANTGNLVSQTIWVFDQGSGAYETKVTVDNFVLAPAQGFFVSASSATNLNISKFLYQANSGNAFQKTVKTEVKLMMNDGTNNRFAKLYYLDNTTTGFDNGFDGETFGGIANTIDVFTHLVADSEGKKYQVQSLPNSDYENMIVPIGVIAAAGKEITFTAEALNLPSGIKVFLEDKLTNTFTRLDEANSNYKVTLSENVNGIGRFYLHTKSSALSVDDVTMNGISIYKTTNSNLRIVGLSQGKSTVKLFNMLGKQVLTTSFTSNGVHDISLPKLATGIYIINLETETGKLNRKITLE